MRVVSWNVHRASSKSSTWQKLLEFSPDIVLLQEATSIPTTITSNYEVRHVRAGKEDGSPQEFGTAVMVKGRIVKNLELHSSVAWVNLEIERFSGNLISTVVRTEDGTKVNVVSVYCPAWPIDRERLAGYDVSTIKLKDNPDVWLSEILWSSLKSANIGESDHWIVAGDFNSSETLTREHFPGTAAGCMVPPALWTSAANSGII